MGTEAAFHRIEADLKAEIATLKASLAASLAQAEAERQSAAAEHARLTFELGHRVKNTLSVVQALAGQTMRGAATKDEALDAFGSRILALARANDVILAQSWTTASIGSVAESVLRPFESRGRRLTIAGDDIRIPAGSALSLAMALNELGANAQRFGAWSVEGGAVSLRFSLDASAPEGLWIEWRESGGPAATAPAMRGFGLKLIEQSLRSAFGRNIDLSFDPAGFVCTVRAAPPGAAA